MGGVELAAVGLAGMFAGGATYVSIAEHPARLRLPVREAVAEFGPSYKRAAFWQGGLAAASLATGLGAWADTAVVGWLVGSTCVAGLLALTVGALLRPSYALIAAKGSDDELAALLRRWGRLHALRAILGVAALAAFLVAAR